ncbi:MAG: hypothetical protein K6T65_16465 [Peptococcaceae bacterium]|nr:hypothetical protein [Peptococcaceae bacterium]
MIRIMRFLIILIVTLCISLPAHAAPRVVLDGQFLKFDTPPVIESGTTLVPLRQIFESLGASVSWDAATKKIVAGKDSAVITLSIGSVEAFVNDKKITLNVPPKIVDGRTLVPLRFISESFGAQVDWDQIQEIAVIKSPKPKTIEQRTPTGKLAKVHFINLGSADAIYVSLPDKIDILIDSGRDDQYREVPQKVVSYLQDQGVDDIDILVVSAPLKDYMGYLDKVFYNFEVEKVIESGKDNPIKEHIDFKNYSLKSRSRETANKQHFDFNGITFDVLTSPGIWEEVKDHSVISKLTYGDVSFLFTGAANIKNKENMAGDLSAKILKVADHGSRNSVSADFLKRVKPEAAVIFVGSNPFGWPDRETIDLLNSNNVAVYRTDEYGNIVISTDGKVYEITTETNPKSSTQTQPQAKTKYIADTEKNVYHKSSCPLTEEILPVNKVVFEHAFDLTERGFIPCKVCN